METASDLRPSLVKNNNTDRVERDNVELYRDMSKEDRKEHLLTVLVEIDAALPVAVLWRNARVRGATYGRTSAKNYIREMHEDGLVCKVDPETMGDEMRFETTPVEESGYYLATDDGHEYVRS